MPNPLPDWRGGGVSNSPNRAFQYTSQGTGGYAGTEADLAAIFDDKAPSARGALDLLIVHGPIESMEPAERFVQSTQPPLVVCGHVVSAQQLFFLCLSPRYHAVLNALFSA